MHPVTKSQPFKPSISHDIILIGSMVVLAGCGLIYEYLLAHYAGRIIGSVESSIYTMIGIMIVAMGVGAFLARWIKDPFSGFVWVEVIIAFFGGSSILIMAALIGLTHTLPQWLQEIYGLHPSIYMQGGVVAILQNAAYMAPFACGFLLGVMIGMEIPLIARIREIIHKKHLQHNIGTIYGADYIGAGIGAAIWVTICLQLPIMVAAIGTASVNALVGMIFLYRYQSFLASPALLWTAHALLIVVLVSLSVAGIRFTEQMNTTLFKDKVVYTKVTPYQHLTLTTRNISSSLPTVLSLYLNGRLQFSSSDEKIYHRFLAYPAMLASARQDSILIIGGGDGLAVREVLRWNPQAVTLIDLDEDMIKLFSGKDFAAPKNVSNRLLQLNQHSLLDDRVQIIIGDAFIEVEQLIKAGIHYDAIIVDLPDPSHPDLNKLYSSYFYERLKELLSGDGAITIQSTSPYHAQKTFISIGKTLAHAGFMTNQYHTNVPTFGEWGWTIGTIHGKNARMRIKEITQFPINDTWISKAQLEAAFIFAPTFYSNDDEVSVNHLGTYLIYNYHHDAWKTEEGIFFVP